MSKPKNPPEAYVELAQKKPFLTNKEIADHFKVDESSVRRAFKKAKFDKGDVQEVKQTVDVPFRIIGDVLLMADIHCPLHNFDYIRTAVINAVNRGVRIVLFCGDFWHCDQYGNYFPHQADIGLDVEIPTGTQLMEWILGHFDIAFFIRGNHDYRYVKGRKYKISFVDAMKDAFKGLSDDAKSKLNFSNLDHAILNNNIPFDHGSAAWYICHPENYSRTPLTNGIKLAAVVNMNVATAHSHHCARGWAVNGIHQVMELGGFFDASRTAYLQSSVPFPKWTPGHALYIDGKMKLESPAWSDF